MMAVVRKHLNEGEFSFFFTYPKGGYGGGNRSIPPSLLPLTSSTNHQELKIDADKNVKKQNKTK